MKAEIITIGDEILIGQVIDSNSAWIAEYFNTFGLSIGLIVSVSDKKENIKAALNEAEKRSDIIITTGGLGPTKDDITKTAFCEYFDTQLIFNETIYNDIKAFVTSRQKSVSKTNRSQAYIPNTCIPLRNFQGTAPGMWFEKNNKVFVSLPGVPYEMKELIKNEVIPRIQDKFTLPFVYHKTIQTIGIAEADLSDLLENFEKNLPEYIKLAYLPSPGYVRLRLSGSSLDHKQLEIDINFHIDKLRSMLAQYVTGNDDKKINELLGEILKEKDLTLSTAESCTGGNIAHLITLVPGSSDYFKGSVIAYSNEIKINHLEVKPNDIDNYGAVSKQVVEQMALGALKLLKTNCAIATSGIAGPTGGTKDKPVGTTWICAAHGNITISRKYYFGENRERNIEKASIYGINLLIKLLLGLKS